MAPRKKQYDSKTGKQRAYEERLKEQGRKRVCLWLPDETTSRLDLLAKMTGKDKAAVVMELVAAAKLPE